MIQIKIRKATQQDKDWIVELYQHNSKQYLTDTDGKLEAGFVQDNPHFDQLVHHWIELSAIDVAELDGQAAGFLVIQREIESKSPEILSYIQEYAHILILQERPLADLRYAAYGPILVDDQFRGKGIAKILHDQSLAELKVAGFDAIVAFIDGDNPVSLKIHDALGMQILDKVVLASGQFFILGQMTGE
ncbi:MULTISPECIES: GNAT family N-acetyltransferase [unclassified Acinetobacter]|uniref:GNAT family N-acetyltransferase n=1 Tax=unclassified Acinetobacter TaxID=196816 RepID=UPI0019095B26|nr:MULTISPECIES: GNAT family N-acetyltransferase [unclassified Acinetobacter]MBK0064034.1 GNAT family N-acetyltransferase [Acinetobacter sp. S55]MBK0067457.1 GNAT family N-acetyltransferase [Acinetobacter sp. S54]